ncbi:MAG: tetratricopeptide repeat protein, partial [Akkermansiaceae bacterium]|nr:tetratricopeptide repeat protein [Akkermansiaceae bacterium]
MSKQPTDSSVPLAEISHGPSKFERFLENNQKLVLLLILLVIVGIAAFIVVSGIQKGLRETAGAKLIEAADADALKTVIDEHSGTQAAKSAHLLLAESQWNDDKQDASIATLEIFIAEHGKHPAMPTAKASLASKWMIQGETEKAVALFEKLANGEDRYIAPYALISLGDIAASSGELEAAESHYQRVTREFADSEFVFAAESRINDLGAEPPTEIPAPKAEENVQPIDDLSDLSG